MFQKILATTGGSPWSNHAVDTAIELARCLQQHLVIAHVLEADPQFQATDLDPSNPQLREHLEATGKRILQQAVKRAQEANFSPRTVMLWGAITEQIIQAAQEESCDLIVMGTRHLSGGKRLMTGRICNAVLATSPCPVLVVPLIE